MKKPNFFIVGFAKSGTTSLRRLLAQHPSIFISKPEEPHYFCKDLHKESDKFHGKRKRFRYRTKKDYLKLFSGAKKEKRVGESSVFYLYSKVAAKEIKKFNPKAKIIIMLRDPIEFLRSMHAHNVLYKIDQIKSLEKALKAEKKRKRDSSEIREVVNFPSRLYYSDLTKFSEQIERYLAVFPKKQVKIILLDDLKKNPEKTYKEVLEYLGVKDFRPRLNKHNVSSVPKNKMLHNFLYEPNKIKEFLKKFVPFKIYDFVYNLAAKINKKPGKKPRLDENVRKKLKKKYKKEVKKLSEITKRNLISLWNY